MAVLLITVVIDPCFMDITPSAHGNFCRDLHFLRFWHRNKWYYGGELSWYVTTSEKYLIVTIFYHILATWIWFICDEHPTKSGMVHPLWNLVTLGQPALLNCNSRAPNRGTLYISREWILEFVRIAAQIFFNKYQRCLHATQKAKIEVFYWLPKVFFRWLLFVNSYFTQQNVATFVHKLWQSHNW